ncbi:hypothetical protein [Amycolatopsis sp. CA-230715]|uniref:hypothetical protein n=1 Tax=Amycolatopsis sp. CA-230715 TaxID=2745196 RepID=UPI001C024ABA|nr:hypothetical protein [Amycolatopsis sp. CA-230715]QWF80651.1 hypothetical protein HUW46_04074 [Amycolatopsis sp. CA-230715]
MTTPTTQPPSDGPPLRRRWLWVGAVALLAVALIVIISAATGGRKIAGSASPDTAVPITPPTTDPSVEAAQRSAASASAASSSSAAASASAAASKSSAAAASSSAEAARQSSVAAEASAKAAEEAERKAKEIIYSVTTTGPGINSVTYTKQGFNISQETAVKGKKWSRTVQDMGSDSYPSVNAQNDGGGTIRCSIKRGDGTVLSENSSSGDYAVVTCS